MPPLIGLTEHLNKIFDNAEKLFLMPSILLIFILFITAATVSCTSSQDSRSSQRIESRKLSDLPDSAQNLVYKYLTSRDISSLARSSKTNRDSIHSHVPGFAKHKDIINQCGQSLGQKLLTSFYEVPEETGDHGESFKFMEHNPAHDSFDFSIFENACLQAVRGFCVAHEGIRTLSALNVNVIDVDDIIRLPLLYPCKLNLNLMTGNVAVLDQIFRINRIQELTFRINEVEDEFNMPSIGGISETLERTGNELRALRLYGPMQEDASIRLIDALHHLNCKLETLYLFEAGLQPLAMKKLGRVLQSPNNQIKHLNLGKNDFSGNNCTIILSQTLKSAHNKIESLSLEGVFLDENSLLQLTGSFLQHNCRVRNLILAENQFGTQGAWYIAQILRHAANQIEYLDISFSSIMNQGIVAISDSLISPHCKLKYFDIAGNILTAFGIEALTEAIKHENCKLNRLSLAHNPLDEEDMQDISNALIHRNNKITHLDFSISSLSSEAMIILCDALKHRHNKLEHLDFSDNELEDVAVFALSRALRDRKNKLRHLSLSHNHIGPVGIRSIASSLRHPNNQLRYLNLGFNHIGDESVMNISSSLISIFCKLDSLLLQQGEIGPEGGAAIARAIDSGFVRLSELDLAFNNIGSDSGSQIIYSLAASRHHIRDVNLVETGVPEDLIYEVLHVTQPNLIVHV